jgi:glycolate oxidase FAD binding subunit
VAQIRAEIDCTAIYDWAGGLIWLSVPPSTDASEVLVRSALTQHGGHATLMRAAPDVRAATAVFQPQAPALAALSTRVKAAFDPEGTLNPGRMYKGV